MNTSVRGAHNEIVTQTHTCTSVGDQYMNNTGEGGLQLLCVSREHFTSRICGDSYMHAGTIAEATHLALWAEQGVGQEH